MTDILVIGAGPAGVLASLRAADLGARTTLVTSAEFGGMAANVGPVPVRTVAHAAKLIRDARQLRQYGVAVGEPALDYSRLLARVREVVNDVRQRSSLQEQIDRAGVTIHENVGHARFVDPHEIITESGLRLAADKFVICTGGVSRPLGVPGVELTTTHRDAWALTSVPQSLLVVGGGSTGVQVASTFNGFGARVHLFEKGPRILKAEDEDLATTVASGFCDSGMVVREKFGAIESFEKTPAGVRMNFSKDGKPDSVEAALAVVAPGWVADTTGLDLAAAGVASDPRGFVKVDEYLRTSASHIFAAGDVTGHEMLVPPAIQEGFMAATNAVLGPRLPRVERVNTIAGFTDPEYARAGLTEAKARETRDVLTALVHFDASVRNIIDGRTAGFCKLIVDRNNAQILGCHVVGERAVENIDATAMQQAGIGAGYIKQIIKQRISTFMQRTDTDARDPVKLEVRKAFNPNGVSAWFTSVVAIINQLTLLTVVLTGAAVIREREHGTLEHLLVMPLTALEIAIAKVWANGLVILLATALSLFLIVQMALQVPFAGSHLLWFSGVVFYLVFATALGIFLGTISRSMAQFALLLILAILVLQLLSGGSTPVESQPGWLQKLTYLLPPRHFVSFCRSSSIAAVASAPSGVTSRWWARSVSRSLRTASRASANRSQWRNRGRAWKR